MNTFFLHTILPQTSIAFLQKVAKDLGILLPLFDNQIETVYQCDQIPVIVNIVSNNKAFSSAITNNYISNVLNKTVDSISISVLNHIQVVLQSKLSEVEKISLVDIAFMHSIPFSFYSKFCKSLQNLDLELSLLQILFIDQYCLFQQKLTPKKISQIQHDLTSKALNIVTYYYTYNTINAINTQGFVYNSQYNLLIEKFPSINLKEEDLNKFAEINRVDINNFIPKELHNFFSQNEMTFLTFLYLSEEEFLLYKGITPIKLPVFKEFKQTLIDNIDLLHNYSTGYKVIKEINYDNNISLLGNIHTYIRSFIDHYTNDQYLYTGLGYSFEQKRNLETLTPLQSFYFEYPSYNYKELSQVIGLSGERIRQLITSNSLRDYTNSPENYKLILRGDLVELINNILEDNSFSFDAKKILQLDQNTTLEEANKNLNLFNYEVIEEENNWVIIPNTHTHSVSIARNLIRAITQVLKNEYIPISLLELISKIEVYIESKETNQLNTSDINIEYIEKILSNNIYETIESEDQYLYQIRFDLLGSLELKVRKILHLNEEALTKNEIKERLNLWQSTYNAEIYTDKTLFIKSSEYITSLGNNNWIYSEYHQEEDRKVPTEFIEDFIIKNNGRVTFEQVKEELINNKYNIANNSIRSYILNTCRLNEKDKNDFVHNDFIEQYPEVQLQKQRNNLIGKEIIDYLINYFKSGNKQKVKRKDFFKEAISFFENTGITVIYNQIHSYVSNFVDNNIFILEDGYLSYNYDNENQTIIYREEPLYRQQIRSLAIEYIKNHDNETIELSKLREALIQYLPSELKSSNFYKIFNDSTLFEKTKNENNKVLVRLFEEKLPQQVSKEEEAILTSNEQETLSIPQRQEYIQYIRKPFDINEIERSLLLDTIDYFTDTTHFKRAFGKFKIIMSKFDNIYSTGIYQNMYDLLIGRTDFYDRDAALMRIALFLEPYLRKLLNITETKDENGNIRGLYKLINVNTTINAVYEYNYNSKNNVNPIDYKKRAISRAFNTYRHYRNDTSHNSENTMLQFGTTKQIQTYTSFLATLIYLADVV